MPLIRTATMADAQAVADVYAPYVTDSAISFEVEPPSADVMRDRIATVTQQYPWLICELDGVVSGYAYATRHRDRPAYQWSVDVSVYLTAACRGQGLGRALYRELFDTLRGRGFFTVCAGITLPNPASVALHEGMGMKPVGVYRNIGYKHGRWHDVGWWQGALQPHPEHPTPVS